jgi:hypothetical protein
METGNKLPYKHSNLYQAKLENSILSIRIFTDGLSVSIHQENTIWFSETCYPIDGVNLVEKLASLWEKYSFLRTNFSAVRVQVNSLFSTFLPEKAFKEASSLKSYLSFLFPYEEVFMNIRSDFHPIWNAYHVYTIRKDIEDFIHVNITKNPVITHDSHELLIQSSETKSIQNRIFISQYKDLIHCWICKGNNLQFFNSFLLEVDNNEEVSYKLLRAFEENNLDLINDIFYVYGPLEAQIKERILLYIPQFVEPKPSKFSGKAIQKIDDSALLYRL